MTSGITRTQIANMSLEEDFRKAYEDATARMDAKEDEARKLIQEIVQISEETGIPFRAIVSPLSQTYRPHTFIEKWGETINTTINVKSKYSDSWYDTTIFEDVAEYGPGEHEGWQHSAVCY